MFVYDGQDKVVDSMPLRLGKYASLLRSKDDVFLLYRGWLELQSQQIKEAISQTTALLNRQDTGLYIQTYRSNNRKELLLAVAQFKTEQQDVERKISAMTLPDEQMVYHMLQSNYSSGGTQITYLAVGMGFAYTASNSRGEKEYELSNHLGNVMATVRDRKLGIDGGSGTVAYYNVDVVNSNDYYPFGAWMPGRLYSKSEKYRYGFNGKENDNEVKGGGNQQDYGMRVYDSRVGRFLSVDPLTKAYPELTPYQFASNIPIAGIDLDGLEYYYAADGSYLGRGSDPKNKEVRLATATEVYTSTGKQIVRAVNLNCENVKDWVLISKNHDLFQQFAAFGYNENTVNAGSQHATQNVIMNRAKGNQDKISSVMGQMAGSGIGGTHEKRMRNKWFVSYAEYINTSIEDRSNNYRMRSATMGAIQTMLGKDITGGATYEKGLDFFSSKLRADGTNWPDYIDYRDNGMKWDINGTFNGTYTPDNLTDHKGLLSKDFKYIGTASYGGNTFLIDNPDYGKTKPKDENSTTPTKSE